MSFCQLLSFHSKDDSFLSAMRVTGTLHCCITLTEGEPSNDLGEGRRVWINEDFY